MKDQLVLERVRQVIEEVDAASDLQELSNFYRIRVGEYRIGTIVEKEVVEFVRCLPRRDLYRHFP